MATHDYVIANGTGAAVRSDLNNALAAIVSNNSGSSEPGTTYAYQWWADTNANVLKLRNSANNGWITLRELDGTMLIEDGSAASPGLAFADDTNTGIFSPAADQIGFATGGAERLEIGSSEVVFNDPSNDVDFRVESNGQTHMLFVDAGNDKVGIGTSTVSNTLDVRSTGANIGVRSTTSGQNQYIFLGNTADSTNAYLLQTGSELRLQQQDNVSGSQITFYTKDSERARIDSSGRLLVGTSSFTGEASAVLEGSSAGDSVQAQLWLNRGGSAPVTDNALGQIIFGDSTAAGRNGAMIQGRADGDWAANDYPSRLVFLTTADGASSPTEHLRIEATGDLIHKYSDSSTSASSQVPPGLRINNTDNTSGRLAGIHFSHGGAGTANAGIFHVTTNTSTGSTTCLGDLAFYMKASGSSTMSEAMRLDSSGRLLMGTTTSTYNISNQTKLGVVITGDTSRGGIDITGYTGGTSTGTAPEINFNRSIGTTDGSVTALTANPWILGRIFFSGSTGSNFSTGAEIRGVSASQAYTGSQSGGELRFFTVANSSTTLSERVRIDNSGKIYFQKSTTAFNTEGAVISQGDGNTHFTTLGGTVCSFNRGTNDGKIISLLQGGNEEGTISVSGSTVSYNGAHLSRWSQLAGGAERTEILRGSVLSNLDEMCEWAYDAQDAVLYTEEDELPEGVSVGDVKTPARDAGTEDNEQLNRMKVSDVEGDVNVAGVFQAWDDDDDTYTNDFFCAMTGDFVIRIAQGTTVARGDLLMSAGDGTAKPQDDDIVRSKTIAKVTSTTVSTTYSDGSYCVPCVLMAC